jgi:hypothetical protein
VFEAQRVPDQNNTPARIAPVTIPTTQSVRSLQRHDRRSEWAWRLRHDRRASPFVTPTAPGWGVVSLVTVGDGAAENGYRMVGIPDGLGALAGKFENGRYVADKAFMTILLNHELGGTSGGFRAHGVKGAFVSQWTVHLNSLEAKWGPDLIEHAYTWDQPSQQYVYANGTPAAVFNRFCSADLPSATAFFNPVSGKGFQRTHLHEW